MQRVTQRLVVVITGFLGTFNSKTLVEMILNFIMSKSFAMISFVPDSVKKLFLTELLPDQKLKPFHQVSNLSCLRNSQQTCLALPAVTCLQNCVWNRSWNLNLLCLFAGTKIYCIQLVGYIYIAPWYNLSNLCVLSECSVACKFSS